MIRMKDRWKEKEGRRKGSEGNEEKRRSVQQLAGQPATTWQRRCPERQNGGKLFHPHFALEGMNTSRWQGEYIWALIRGAASYSRRN